MRLLYITDARIPTEKAHGYQIIKTCEAFARAGVATELIAPRIVNPIGTDPFLFYGVRPDFNVHFLSVPHIPRSLPFPFSLIPHYAGLFFFARAVRSFIRAHGAAGVVIYTRSGALVPFLSAYAPVIYEVHGFSRTSFFFRRAYDAAAHIVAVTDGIKNILVRRGVSTHRITVAPDGVDLSAFEGLPKHLKCRISCGISADSKVVGYVGRFTVFNKEKGVPLLIEAMGLLRKQYPSLRLLLVGGPTLAVRGYRRMADECGFGSENIVYIPPVPARDVGHCMRACDALTIPLPRTVFSALYTSPLKMFEYMASGVPIVASDLPALREVISERNAFFAAPDDARALARALAMVFDNPEEAHRRAAQALCDVRAYTWDARARRILISLSAILT